MASFAIPRRAPVLVLAEPDFSKIDCNWEVNRLLQSEIARDLLWSILFLSALAETYHAYTPAICLSFFREARGSHFCPVRLSNSEILAALKVFEDSKLVSIEVNRDIYTITPLVETWESLEPVV